MRGDLEPEGTTGLQKLVAERARNLFLSRQLYCSEAVLVSLNNGLGGGLSERQALALAAPFAEGIGDSGCLCGALGGALLGLGCLLGRENPAGSRKLIQKSSAALLRRFKLQFGSTCCRILSKQVRADRQAHFQQCAEFTASAAAAAAGMILQRQPALISAADHAFLNARDSTLGGILKSGLRRAGCWRD